MSRCPSGPHNCEDPSWHGHEVGEHEELFDGGYFCHTCSQIVTRDHKPAHVECIDFRDDGSCSGVVQFNSVDGRGSAPPRCAKHFDDRLDRRENSVEKYAETASPPSWFDPMNAGEAWGPEDY